MKRTDRIHWPDPRTQGEAIAMAPSKGKLVSILLEEYKEIADAATMCRLGNMSPANATYWLERAAENMRRYAEWLKEQKP